MRKKLFLAAMLLAGMVPAMADNYPYLTFETTDGAKASVSVESLTLTVNGTTLTVGSQSFTLSNLAKMYFSMSDETSEGTTAIDEVESGSSLLENAEIYDLNGRKVEQGKWADGSLPRGVYIVKTKERTCKIVVR